MARLVEVRAKVHVEGGRTIGLAGVNIEVEGSRTSTDDLLNQLAGLSGKVASLAARLDDAETSYFARMLLVHVGQRLATRIADGRNTAT